jgi:hypothetical protein
MSKKFLCALALATSLAVPAHAAQVCAWIVETNGTDEDERDMKLWLQSDAEIDFMVRIDGKGIVNAMGNSNSPMSATFTLHPGEADSPWSYGATLDAPAKIDETVILSKMPADIFSDAPTPVLATFTFRRDVPESEKAPPATFARKQCASVHG